MIEIYSGLSLEALMLSFCSRIKLANNQAAPGILSLWARWTRLLLLAMVFISLYFPVPVQAQTGDSLIVLPPDTSAFPILSTQIKPVLDSGAGAADLRADNLTVLENGQAVPVVDLDKQRAGVHFTLAINGDRRLDVRDAQGESPYDRIRAVLTDWAGGRRFSSGDTLSLVTQESARVRSASNRGMWIEALENYQPDFRTMVPDLASLEIGLRLSEERVVPFGVDKTLLYITPPPSPEEITPIFTLTEVARLAGIRVHVWMLGEEFFLSNDQGGALINLAATTGGEFFHYTGVEALPNPENYLEGMGVYYDLQFESGIREMGTYAIRVIAETAAGELSGESGRFYFDVQPPKPILLSPPAEIQREAPQGWEGDPNALIPTGIDIEFMLEFPDHTPRELAFSRLYVDGRLMDERTEPPFETLTWDLTALVEPGEYSLHVLVEDTLGLSGETIRMPVQVEVLLPQPEPTVSNQQVGLIVVGVILAAAVILLVFWLARHFLHSAFAQRLAKKIFVARHKPGTAGLFVSDQEGRVYATLLPLVNGGTDMDEAAIQITQRHTSFGCDPDRVNLVLNGQGIDGLHARLRAVDDKFWLSDSGAAGGTWINFALIDREPVQLFPGDLIHFGPVGFRFTIIDIDSPPKASVSKYEPIL